MQDDDNIFELEPERRSSLDEPVTIPFDGPRHRAGLEKFIVVTVCASWLLATVGTLILLDRHPGNGAVQMVAGLNAVGVPLRLIIKKLIG